MRGDQLSLVGPVEREPPALRYCKCPRKEPMDDLPDSLEYRDRNCRQRAYRARVKAEMERVNLPASPSLRAARVSRATTTHNGDAQIDRKRPLGGKPSGAQVSYFKAIEVLHSELGVDRAALRSALRQALSATQRARLEGRSAPVKVAPPAAPVRSSDLPSNDLRCKECGAELRERSTDGLCGFCRAEREERKAA